MRHALAYLALLALGVAGILYMANLGGVVEVRVADLELVVPFALALLFLAIAFLLLHWLLNLVTWLRRWPRRQRAKRAARRRGEGDQAVTRALVALAA
ncbi:heme biosynthesis HemY N-terminal domain-containing protein, partial [Falsiroseomonas oryzae]|uniref:heme biosynthesis HemY N-terminal domain-containing protein n=1 Tax=Falsiroseomonas oryzae TaxID=2766473 RepID=UPI0022EA210D